jgi:hypothetical protein
MLEVGMLFKLGLENNIEGRSLVWVLGHPGCFGYGQNANQALEAAPRAIREYVDWIGARTEQSWLTPENIETHLEETWQVYDIDENYQLTDSGYSVNAWFRNDWLPLSEEDVSRGLQLLAWSREDLLAEVSELTSEQLEASYPGERWNIAGILRHVGGAEWWYLDRLGLAFPRQEVPDDPIERLVRMRKRLEEVLPGLVGSSQVVGIEGEFWSGRKLLRRAVWHERDHTGHIRKLLNYSG